jgi:ribonuclease HI
LLRDCWIWLKVTLELFTDGLAEPRNPGIGTYAYIVYRDGRLLTQDSGLVGESVTNNEAEYEALIRGLKAVLPYSGESIVVYSDSQLLVHQMKGEWKVKKGAYKERHLEAKRLAAGFEFLEFKWIPREMNEKADALTNEAYQRYLREKGLR